MPLCPLDKVGKGDTQEGMSADMVVHRAAHKYTLFFPPDSWSDNISQLYLNSTFEVTFNIEHSPLSALADAM